MTRKQGKNRKPIANHGKGSASIKSQSGRKRVTLWFLGLVTVAITALVTTTFTNLGNVTSSFIGDLFSSTGLPVHIDSVRVIPLPAHGDSHAFANALVLSDTELSQLNLLRYPSSYAWFVSRHAVDVGSTGTEIVIEGNRNHTVRITDMQPVVSCQSPLTGTLFFSPPAGAEMSTQLLFDLDNPNAPPSYIMQDQNGNPTQGKDFFGTYTVSLKQGEQYTFKVIGGHFACKSHTTTAHARNI